MKQDELVCIATGTTDTHLVRVGQGTVRIHQAVAPAFERLAAKAHRAGFELEIVSGFRSFDAQLAIWNAKARGERPLMDASGGQVFAASLSVEQLVDTILLWSALPGASRHHWGTDMDVIDRLSVPPRYRVQLIPQEVGPGGMFSDLHDWLDRHMAEEGFFRPYQEDLGGVKPERWHLSHAPTSQAIFHAHSLELLRSTLEAAEMDLKPVVLAKLDALYERYFLRVASPTAHTY